MQLFLEDKPIILRLLEDTYYSQIIPRIICQSLVLALSYNTLFFVAFLSLDKHTVATRILPFV